MPDGEDQISGLGRALKVARAELGLSRRDLAMGARLSYPYIAEFENGTKQPSAKAFSSLAEALQLSPAELMARAEGLETGARLAPLRSAQSFSEELAHTFAQHQPPRPPSSSSSESLESIVEAVLTALQPQLREMVTRAVSDQLRRQGGLS